MIATYQLAGYIQYDLDTPYTATSLMAMKAFICIFSPKAEKGHSLKFYVTTGTFFLTKAKSETLLKGLELRVHTSLPFKIQPPSRSTVGF